MENEYDQWYKAVLARFRILYFEVGLTVFHVASMLLTETNSKLRQSHPSSFKVYRLYAVLQAVYMFSVTVWLMSTRFVSMKTVKMYCISNLIRSYVFCMTTWLMLPSNEFVWYLAPIFLLIVKVVSWNFYQSYKDGGMNSHGSYSDHCAADRTRTMEEEAGRRPTLTLPAFQCQMDTLDSKGEQQEGKSYGAAAQSGPLNDSAITC